MSPTGQTGNNSVINIRWLRCPLPSDPCLALPYSKSSLKTHSVLFTKTIQYPVFQLGLSHWFMLCQNIAPQIKMK